MLIAFDEPIAQAQTITADMLRAVPGGFLSPQDSPLRRTAMDDKTGDAANDARLRDKDGPAPSRIGNIPTYGLPAANGAKDTGFDSLGRTRKKPKLYPGQAKPKPSPGPGTPARTDPARCERDPARASQPPMSTSAAAR